MDSSACRAYSPRLSQSNSSPPLGQDALVHRGIAKSRDHKLRCLSASAACALAAGTSEGSDLCAVLRHQPQDLTRERGVRALGRILEYMDMGGFRSDAQISCSCSDAVSRSARAAASDAASRARASASYAVLAATSASSRCFFVAINSRSSAPKVEWESHTRERLGKTRVEKEKLCPNVERRPDLRSGRAQASPAASTPPARAQPRTVAARRAARRSCRRRHYCCRGCRQSHSSRTHSPRPPCLQLRHTRAEQAKNEAVPPPRLEGGTPSVQMPSSLATHRLVLWPSVYLNPLASNGANSLDGAPASPSAPLPQREALPCHRRAARELVPDARSY